MGGPLKGTTSLCLTLSLLALAFAGCTSPGVEKQDGSGGGTSPPPSTTATSATSGSSQNQAPTVALAVLVDGQAVSSAGGQADLAPGNVTLDASASSDPDGDALVYAWTLDGAALDEATATVQLTLQEGTYAVGLSVSDGTDAATAELTLLVAAPTVQIGDAPITYKFTGTFAQKVTAHADDAAVHHLKKFQVPAGAQGLTAWLVWNEADESGFGVLGDIDLRIRDPKNALVGTSAGLEYEFIRVKDASKMVAGEWTADLRPYLTVDTDYELTVIVWMAAPTEKKFTGATQAAANQGGTSTATARHAVEVPAGATTLTGRLEWVDDAGASKCQDALVRAMDYDLYLYKGTTRVGVHGAWGSCEFVMLRAAEGETLEAATYEFRVAAFAVALSKYELVVEYA